MRRSSSARAGCVRAGADAPILDPRRRYMLLVNCFCHKTMNFPLTEGQIRQVVWVMHWPQDIVATPTNQNRHHRQPPGPAPPCRHAAWPERDRPRVAASRAARPKTRRGRAQTMKIERQFTTAGQDAYAALDFVTTSSEIRNPDGSTVFRLDEIEVPGGWSQVASDVIAQKYFRKAGVPNKLEKIAEDGVPEFLWRSRPAADNDGFGGETSARQVFDRLAGAWTYWGWQGGYFSTEADARAYFDEMRVMLARQMARPTRRNGSTPGCTGPMASTGRGRGITTSITPPASSPAPNRPTSTRSRMPASSSRSRTIWWAMAASWISGCARRGCSSTARGRGPISRQPARRGRKALGRRQILGSHGLSQDRRPRGGRDQVGRHHAPRGQDGDLRRRPPRYRGIHQLEGEGRTEGREHRRRLQGA